MPFSTSCPPANRRTTKTRGQHGALSPKGRDRLARIPHEITGRPGQGPRPSRQRTFPRLGWRLRRAYSLHQLSRTEDLERSAGAGLYRFVGRLSRGICWHAAMVARKPGVFSRSSHHMRARMRARVGVVGSSSTFQRRGWDRHRGGM